MELRRIPWDGRGMPDEASLRRRMQADGFEAFRWRDAPGARYAPHRHEHDERLQVLEGCITFGAGGREWRLGPGDRLDLPRDTVHTAHVGADGATYLIGQRTHEEAT